VASESAIALQLRREREQQENLKNLALASQVTNLTTAPAKDRLVVIVRDSFWLQGYWEITKASVDRARVAIGTQWHLAKPVLRIMKVVSDGPIVNWIRRWPGQVPHDRQEQPSDTRQELQKPT